MADEPLNDDIELTEDEEASPNVKRMRDRIKALEKELKGTESVARENAFLKAGVDLASPVGQMFAKAYDGKLETAEIVKAAEGIPGVIATEAKTPEPEPAPEISAEEQQATAERQALASGATPDGGVTEHPSAVAAKAAKEVLDDGGNSERAMATMLNSKVQAAMAGDKRALVQAE